MIDTIEVNATKDEVMELLNNWKDNNSKDDNEVYESVGETISKHTIKVLCSNEGKQIDIEVIKE